MSMLQVLWALVLALVAILLAVGIVYKILPFRRVTIFEYQRGLKYSKGRYSGTVPAGQYWVFPAFTSIVPVDVRPEFITITGQDVLSADGVTLKVSLAAEFEVADPHVAVNKNANFRSALYLTLQMALREIVGKEKIDDLMQNRSAIGAKLMEMTQVKSTEFGLKLKLADVKDIMFPGEMKKAFSQVVKAQKEGQAALEKARGETAALRSLANAAKMIEDNPNLLQLRALQSLADSGGNTLVLGLPNNTLPLTKRTDKKNASESKMQKDEE
jgi:regulator of protease activity HflC (stomatin/prohibitin superfamily)